MFQEMQKALNPSFAHEVMTEVDADAGSSKRVKCSVLSTSPEETDRQVRLYAGLFGARASQCTGVYDSSKQHVSKW